MKKNRLRVTMTILATTMACAFLIVLASVGFGIQKSIVEEIMDNQVITEVTVHGKSTAAEEGITEKDINEMKEIDHVNAVVTRTHITGHFEAALNDRSGEVWVMTTNMEEELKGNLQLDEGTIATNENEVVVGYHVAQYLLTEKERELLQQHYENPEANQRPVGFTESLLGEKINLQIIQYSEDGEKEEVTSKEYTVVGVWKKPTREWQEDLNIYVSDVSTEELISLAQEHYPTDDVHYSQVYVYVDALENVEGVSETLKEQNYYVYSITDELKSVNMFFTAFKIGLIFVGTVAIVIASIGIFNTMTMAVTERTQEIGIMKAIGADPTVIRKMFLFESAYIGIIGTSIGIIASYGISYLANLVLPLILESTLDGSGPIDFTFTHIPISLVLISATISIGVAIVSGMRPAIKATNINVLSALRREL